MGDGGSGNITTGYNYFAAVVAGLCEGPVAGCGHVWKNKDRVTLSEINSIFFTGTIPQTAWSYLTTNHPSDALGYSGLCYIASPKMSLGQSGELPNVSFEVHGRLMNKTIVDPGGDPIFTDGSNLFTFNSWSSPADESGYLPIIASPAQTEFVNTLYIKITFSGALTASLTINALSPISISSGTVVDVTGIDITFISLFKDSLTAINIVTFEVANSVTSEVTSYSSSVSGKLDENIAVIVEDFLTDSIVGVGFPLGIYGLSQYSDYCVASNLLFSPAITEQMQASEILSQWLKATNSQIILSEDTLKIIPYADISVTGNGVTYTPDTSIKFTLTDDDFLPQGDGDPVLVSRVPDADAYNCIKVEYVNRANDYNVDVAEAKDQADIESKGLRPMDPIRMHFICEKDTARLVAELIKQGTLYIRNRYKFKLPWNFCLLEPMDIGVITDEFLGLVEERVIITEIEETEEGDFVVTAEEFPIGVRSVIQYDSQQSSPPVIDTTTSPGDAN